MAASYLFPTQSKIKVMEISQASVGEAGAALEAGGIRQRREIIVQQLSSCRLHVQHTDTATCREGLETGTFRYTWVITWTGCLKVK